jgi:hypothetical protein
MCGAIRRVVQVAGHVGEGGQKFADTIPEVRICDTCDAAG